MPLPIPGGASSFPFPYAGWLCFSRHSSLPTLASHLFTNPDPIILMSSTSVPPVAKKMKHEMEMFGDVRVDNYYWLHDDSRSNTDVLSHLKAENAYRDLMMSEAMMMKTL